ALGSDHGGFYLKEHIKKYLQNKGYEVKDFGTDKEVSCDYPVYAKLACCAVLDGDCDCAMLFCGTGIGVSIAANKIKGIRAALCSDPVSAALAKQHNNANCITLGGRIIGPVMAEAIVDAYLTAEFEGGRHKNRIDMLE
ncbi:MAG: ribose 5-phosphate isomerase B, partial [Clostridiaceae bacterium]|nr:ribose 5-phosphate isomerase B [Clostridiaceae bacterium]